MNRAMLPVTVLYGIEEKRKQILQSLVLIWYCLCVPGKFDLCISTIDQWGGHSLLCLKGVSYSLTTLTKTGQDKWGSHIVIC